MLETFQPPSTKDLQWTPEGISSLHPHTRGSMLQIMFVSSSIAPLKGFWGIFLLVGTWIPDYQVPYGENGGCYKLKVEEPIIVMNNPIAYNTSTSYIMVLFEDLKGIRP